MFVLAQLFCDRDQMNQVTVQRIRFLVE